jgi:colanic acid/amylovoran biosynthesis glycosyltransferase
VLTVAYLANQFPAAVEPYVGEEIQELRRRGIRVIPGSVRRPDAARRGAASAAFEEDVLCLQPLRLLTLLRALGLAVRRWKRVAGLVTRVILLGKESPKRRLKALLHTWLGAYYAVVLREYGVDHIHVHHGYFGSWIGMVAARLLGVGFSLTLHGSDLLVHGTYLDTKLENCRFCLTVSEFNRRYILEHFPSVDPRTILVSRLGVDVPEHGEPLRGFGRARRAVTLLAVGRLHAVKDHAFLIRACARLRDCGVEFECAIAGEGPERRSLESLIRSSGLQGCITLLGHVPRMEMDMLYRRADALVLTSRSEGIPLVLMEAMARGKIVLAPAITGIPEIVIPGKTGFLYAPGNLQDFAAKILSIQKLMRADDRNAVGRLDWIQQAARAQVLHNFSRRTNMARFGDRFLLRIASQELAGQDLAEEDFVGREFVNQDLANQDWSPSHENSVLQQI